MTILRTIFQTTTQRYRKQKKRLHSAHSTTIHTEWMSSGQTDRRKKHLVLFLSPLVPMPNIARWTDREHRPGAMSTLRPQMLRANCVRFPAEPVWTRTASVYPSCCCISPVKMKLQVLPPVQVHCPPACSPSRSFCPAILAGRVMPAPRKGLLSYPTAPCFRPEPCAQSKTHRARPGIANPGR